MKNMGIIVPIIIALVAVATMIFNYVSPACCKENSARIEKLVTTERHNTDIRKIELALDRLEDTIHRNHGDIMEVLLDK